MSRRQRPDCEVCGHALGNNQARYCSMPCRRIGFRQTEPEFWARIERLGDDDCWLWQGCTGTRMGYGISGRGRRRYAHRTAFEYVNGRIPEGMIVRHSCDTPRCCNPRHLLVGTPKDNTRDAIERGRFRLGRRS